MQDLCKGIFGYDRRIKQHWQWVDTRLVLRNSMISKESAGPKLSAIGHTSSSLSLEFTIFVHNLKTLNKGCEFNLQEVAEAYR